MTVQTTNNKTIVLGNGVMTVFAFDFVGVASAYIAVILTDSSGNETVLSQGSGATQYQIALNSPVAGAVWGVGGTITYNPSGTPVPAGSTLTIFRTLPLTQAISLQNQNSLATLGNGAETGLDTSVMQLQQVSETISRAIVAPIVDATPPAPLPPIAQRANKGAAFDSAGNLVAGATPASGVISTAMQPVVDAATLALGRAAFGLGNMAVENIGAGLQDDGSGNVRTIQNVIEVAVNQPIIAADHTNYYQASGALIFSLARANTTFEGFSFKVNALTAAITFTPDSHDSFPGLSGGQSLTISKGSVATITTNANSSGTWFIDTDLPPVVPVSPNVITHGAGTGTYVPSAGVVWTRIRLKGPGGGGGGGNNSAASANASNSTFVGPGSVPNLAAGGGHGASAVSAGGAGGAASGGNVANIPGGGGGPAAGVAAVSTGNGGGDGGGGAGLPASGAGQAGAANSGGGGGGGAGGVSTFCGGGGGEGGYVEHIINGPSGTYNWTVAAGTAGATGTTAGNGGAGADGYLIIEEYFGS